MIASSNREELTLQDAAPVKFSQEFSGYASAVSKAVERIRRASDALKELGVGGTAVGTGLNTHPDYAAKDHQGIG